MLPTTDIEHQLQAAMAAEYAAHYAGKHNRQTCRLLADMRTREALPVVLRALQRSGLEIHTKASDARRQVKPGRVVRMPTITRDYVKHQRESVFVFGDNMLGVGFGGQAGAMRGEPNTIGIPTKWRPERHNGAYFKDADFDNPHVRKALNDAFADIERALLSGRDVVVPQAGIGTGLAQLQDHAPRIQEYIDGALSWLEETYA